MLIVDEEGDAQKAFAAFAKDYRHFPDELSLRDAFDAGWKAGRTWERAHHAAMARELSGAAGEHSGHDTGTPPHEHPTV